MSNSMTGYGSADFSIREEDFTLEVKSLNHRYLDVKLKAPDRFFFAEERVKEELKKRFSRGHFSLFIRPAASSKPEMALNLDVAKAYIEAAGELKKLGVEGEANLTLLLSQRDIFSRVRDDIDVDVDWKALKAGLKVALDALSDWRVKEGVELEADITLRLGNIEKMASAIAEKAPEIQIAYREKLTARLNALVSDQVDEARIIAEAAVVAERSDIEEELTRLSVHLERFREYLAAEEPVGRRLDFLCQELLREVNTVGSKISDVEVTQTVVEMKGELEKIREQVQNIE